jgi:uncharacterized protein YbjT (DUF2867 family)
MILITGATGRTGIEAANQLSIEKQLASLAAEAGVAHIVKVSSVESVPGASNPVHRTHWESEEHVRAFRA